MNRLAIVVKRLINWMTRAHQQHHATPARPAIYEVGSPEYNAQVVGMIRTLNEQLAGSGKRIPERTAMEIIRQVSGERWEQQ